VFLRHNNEKLPVAFARQLTSQQNPQDGLRHVSWVFFAREAFTGNMGNMLGRHLAECAPVVMVDRAHSILRERSLPSFQGRTRRMPGTENGWRFQPLHFPERFPGLTHLAKTANCLLLRRELDRITPKSSDRIICYDSPSQCFLARRLGERVSVYLAIDDRTVTLGGDLIPGELETEKELLEKVDHVVCVSKPLAEALRSRMQKTRSTPIHILPNGYDEQSFDPRRVLREPQTLAGVPKPRILVAGHVSDRIDWDGVQAASNARPEYRWVFVGRADAGMPEKIAALGNAGGAAFPRMIWIPPVALEDVPALIAHSDLCAVPYRLNSFTLASSPLKAIEYLAMGAPTLSTRIPALRHCGAVIHWVDEGSGDSYIRALDELAKSTNNPSAAQARRATVAGDSWARRVAEFRQLILNGRKDAIPV
jgi:glycosyltransferase involved in cell wall biosynthesis